MANIIKIKITAIVPNKTSLVKPFQVFLYSWSFIQLTLSSFISGIFLIYHKGFSSTLNNLRVKVSFSQ